MPLFEFKLKDIKDIVPWGEEPDLSLSWFGLTDSEYFLNVNGKELFRYSREMVEWWKRSYHSETLSEYVDYQVVRLYEDLLDILPDILQPIPKEIYKYISSIDAHQDFIEKFNEILEREMNDEMLDLHYDAINWLSCRRLDSGYLVGGPNIWLFRYDDYIFIRWNNEKKEIEGIQPWLELKGEQKYSINEFLKEVKLFHDRLMSEMQNRVDTIVQENPLPHVNIDIEYLIEENNQRKDSLEIALQKQPSIDNWDSVLFAITKLAQA